MKIGLAVEDMKRHMTNEGWQIFDGLGQAGYKLYGYNLPNSETDVPKILHQNTEVDTLFIQDRREWKVKEGDFREPKAEFKNYKILKFRDDIFKVSIMKDAHQPFHEEYANEINLDAWVHYYAPESVLKVAPYAKDRIMIRTYHTFDSDFIPSFRKDRPMNCLISGAVSGAYPLRSKIVSWYLGGHIVKSHYLAHPGYHNKGTATNGFLTTLSHCKVMICTASRYQYALRKIFEATACGCRVITDLKEKIPHIDSNLIRIPSDIKDFDIINEAINQACSSYDHQLQKYLSEICIKHYDYRAETKRLAKAIEKERKARCGNKA